jgi:hypothetical protein
VTLILTMFSAFGIVHVTDSNLSDDIGNTDEGPKAFRCARLPAGVACAGAYRVKGEPMDRWLPARISEYEAGASTPTVAGLADWLRRCLEVSMTPEEKDDYSFLHVAGYTWNSERWYPVMYIVSNCPDLDGEGEYLPPDQTFQPLVEKLWSNLTDEQRAQFEDGATHIYINGFPQGRMAYLGLRNSLSDFLQSVWDRKGWHFRRLSSLEDCAIYLRLHLAVIGDLFLMSEYGPIIGGPTQIVSIRPPAAS